MTANFNVVLDRAQGDYFMWLGHDDWLSHRYVEECVVTLSENPDVSLACGQAVYYDDGGELHRGVEVQLLQNSPEARVVGYYTVRSPTTAPFMA